MKPDKNAGNANRRAAPDTVLQRDLSLLSIKGLLCCLLYPILAFFIRSSSG